MSGVLLAAAGTGITFLLTTLGAAVVFFMKKSVASEKIEKIFLGFAAGVMIAASVWSLLIPAIERAEQLGKIGWIPASGGFIIGVLFLMGLDKLLPYFHAGLEREKNVQQGLKRSTLLVFAVTLHNIPEGMAVGVAFGSVIYGIDGATLAAAWTLALGIGLQNFPEGSAVSMPLRRDGFSLNKSFFLGQLSGIVEPIAGVIGALLVIKVRFLLPFLLSFAAGAMIYVVVCELIPESQTNEKKDLMALFTLIGFSVMMILDIALG